MKYFILAVLAFSPLLSHAHGGVASLTPEAVVNLNQNPISPLIGEEVVFSFKLTDRETDMPLANRDVRLSVIRTAFDDPANDREVHSQDFTTDANGDFSFRYAFGTTDYYDVELEFAGASGQLQTTGFLVQPRESLAAKSGALFALGGFLVGALAMWLYERRQKS